VGQERHGAGGVGDQGTPAADGPGTWEALAAPRPPPGLRRAGDPSPRHGTGRAPVVAALEGTAPASAAREASGQGHRSCGRRGQGVGGLRRRAAGGERRGLWTRPRPGGPGCGALQEGPRATAQTVEDRSPGRVQGVARAQREPAGRGHALAPLSEVPARPRASRRQRAAAAGGVEGSPKEQSGQAREAPLEERPGRLQGQRYRQQPLRRGHLPTAQGQTRPRGRSGGADQVVQDAVRDGLAALDAPDVLEGASGCRPGRRAHDAGRPLQRIRMKR
jgi:hypothetical protein